MIDDFTLYIIRLKPKPAITTKATNKPHNPLFKLNLQNLNNTHIYFHTCSDDEQFKKFHLTIKLTSANK